MENFDLIQKYCTHSHGKKCDAYQPGQTCFHANEPYNVYTCNYYKLNKERWEGQENHVLDF